MQEYELFMDVAGDIMPDMIKDNNLHLIPMEFVIDGQSSTYDYFNGDFDLLEFYNEIKKKINIKTSQITPNKYEEYFEPYLSAGKSILYLCLSTGLSDTYNSACVASRNLKEKYPDVDVLVINSLSATAGMGMMAERMIENRGKGLSLQENFNDIESIKGKITGVGVIGDLEMLKRGGRISSATAFLGGLLNIKPIIRLVKENGTLAMQSKCKGMSAGLKYLLNYLEQNRDESKNILYIAHTNEDKYAGEFENMVKEKYPDMEIRKKLLSPIIGAHLGGGSVAIFFYDK